MAQIPTDSSFVMHGARAAMANGFTHIEEQIKGIEQAVIEKPGLAFDLAYTLIESACKAILSERGVAFAPSDDLPKVFKRTINNLPFLPVSASGAVEVRKSLTQTLSGLHTAVQGVCALRNVCGFASHGADSLKPAMETVQALLAAETADAIVGFLHRVHQQDRAPAVTPRLTYDDNPDFNEYVDQENEPVRIFEEDFMPSVILFELATEAYRIYLGAFGTEQGTIDDAAEGTESEETGL